MIPMALCLCALLCLVFLFSLTERKNIDLDWGRMWKELWERKEYEQNILHEVFKNKQKHQKEKEYQSYMKMGYYSSELS